jgi:ATP-dependent DNA helicase RecG
LPGVGQRLAKSMEKLCGGRVLDIAFHLPHGLLDRRRSGPLSKLETGALATFLVEIERHTKPRNPRQPYKVRCSDPTDTIDLVYFNAHEDYLKKLLPVGETRAISGRIDRYDGAITMVHPDHVVPAQDLAKIQIVEPVYPMTAGLAPRILRKSIDHALGRLPNLPEWLDPALKAKRGWPAWRDALVQAHRPAGGADLESASPCRERLAYDELLASQLALAFVRQRNRAKPGRRSLGNGVLTAKALAALPYALTGGQQSALKEITADMASPHRMLRLLQGDVGSGKTIVAFLAMLIALEAGGQAALLAPTDVLARQHFNTLQAIAGKIGLDIALVTGKDKPKTREAAISALATGAIRLVVGTHALVQQDVAFDDLRLAVIDEQHRFGVAQRMALVEKGQGVDLLVMTATPIPRTLLLSAYGDIDVSRLTEKPAGRLTIDTRALPLDRLDDVIQAMQRALRQGDRVYWVCPLVEESEAVDAAAAQERARHLSSVFGNRVGLVHGRQKPAERDATIAAFAEGHIRILVATTVIEVGIDVPEASVMVIEHAERFGLAQLHQLRGRVGRGARKSACLLLYQGPLSAAAKARLTVMRETNDGFVIAEEDLRLRGGGELLGHRQSGLPVFRFADLARHGDLLQIARDDANLVLARDPELETPRGKALRVLLYLFEHDSTIRTLRSG